jgi:hypothetical protein
MAFVINLTLTALLSYILGLIYVRFGQTISNRRKLANDFVILAMTTMIVITIVKSSLALSLGLVGALSIVRFRAAIKEPEELTYLFFTIAIGLGMGANQAKLMVIGFMIITAIIVFKSKRPSRDSAVTVLTLSSTSGTFDIKVVVEILSKHCTRLNLRRFDETDSAAEASFVVETKDFEKLMKAQDELKATYKNVHVSFIDNRGVI